MEQNIGEICVLARLDEHLTASKDQNRPFVGNRMCPSANPRALRVVIVQVTYLTYSSFAYSPY
jgi:hypothetical protein